MPKAPKLSLKIIGPGVVLIAMGLGSGEFILWPYLVAKFGFGVLWGALVGITLQYFVSNETGRYTIATGGSIYEGMSRLSKFLPTWFIISTFFSFAWPGIIGSGGVILGHLLGIEEYKWITVAMLLTIGAILTFGGNVYNNLEIVQKLIIFISVPSIFLISVILMDSNTIVDIGKGLVGIGDGYKILPNSISLLGFLGAVAYSGAGGNLVASHSFYIQDEGMGAAKNLHSQINISENSFEIKRGIAPKSDAQFIIGFRQWMRLSAIEQFFSFWFIGIITIIALVVISFQLLYPFNGEEGLNFVFLQSDLLTERYFGLIGTLFLVVGAVFLFTTQLGIFETTSRIMTENLQLMSVGIEKKYPRNKIFFFFLWLQVFAACIISILDLSAPFAIILVGSFFSALSMFVLSGLMLVFYKSRILPDVLKPGYFRLGIILIAFIFFGILTAITVISELR